MYFWAGIWKYYCHVSNQRPRIFLIPKFGAKIKILKFRTKNVLFEYFWAGTWKNCCHIWNQYPQICLVANYHEITKMHKFETKSALFGYFGLEFKKKLLSYLKSAPSNLSICKNSRMPKFGTRNAWFGHFRAGIWKQYCHISNQHSRICLIAKLRRKTKMPKFGPKNALFGYLWARISKNYCHIWNQHPQICRKWVFNSYSKFWYRVRFF